jgi:putative flippase GtrA
MPPTIDLRALYDDERLRFLVVGGVNTAFAYGVFAALVVTLEHRIHYTILLVITHVISVLFAYALHRRIVFRVRGNVLRDLVKYWSVHLSALAVNLVTLPFLVAVVGLGVLVAQAASIGFTAVVSYLGHKHFSFRRPGTTPPAPAPATPESLDPHGG